MGGAFSSVEFKNWCRENGIELVAAASGGHLQVESVERINGLAKPHFSALMHEHPKVPEDIILQESLNPYIKTRCQRTTAYHQFSGCSGRCHIVTTF